MGLAHRHLETGPARDARIAVASLNQTMKITRLESCKSIDLATSVEKEPLRIMMFTGTFEFNVTGQCFRRVSASARHCRGDVGDANDSERFQTCKLLVIDGPPS